MKTILLVEDNPPCLTSGRLVLESEGYKVLTAEDGKKGLELAIAQTPNLIITDNNMPEMTGYEMVQRLRADERTRNIPIFGNGGFSEKEKTALDYWWSKSLGIPYVLDELKKRLGE